MIAVIARDRHQFDQWIMPWVSVEEHKKFRCISDVESCRGSYYTEYISIGDFYMIRNYDEILAAVKRRIQPNYGKTSDFTI